MLYLRPLAPDKYQFQTSFFGLFPESQVFMRREIVLPVGLANRVQPYLTSSRRFGLRAKLACRCTADDAVALLEANARAPEEIRLKLFDVLAPVVKGEIDRLMKKGYEPRGLLRLYYDFERSLPW